MSGHRGHIGSKPAREVFLTSSSLSFSSLASSVSCDDAIELNTIELNTKESKTSSEDRSHKNGELSKGSEMSGVTHITMPPAQSPPSKLQPVPLMDKGLGNYNPERIPASVFGKTGDLYWSGISNDSLFSLKFDGNRKSNAQASRQSKIKPEEVVMSGDYLRYTPSLLVKPGEAKEKRSQVKEIKRGEAGLESLSHQEKSLSTPDLLGSANPNKSYGLSQAPSTKVQSFALPVVDKKRKKRKKTRKGNKKNKKEKKEEKKENRDCCMWFWLCSVFSKCECDLRCYKWRKCCCCSRVPETMAL